jgi:hypothetical protein
VLGDVRERLAGDEVRISLDLGANGSDRGSTLTKRIELVLTKGGFNPVAVDVVSEESADRTASGLWPSDHAGVVATLQIPG